MTLSIIYYLVYKIKSSPTLWIADIYETIDKKLIKYVENFQSSQEVYYIVSKKTIIMIMKILNNLLFLI